MLSRMPRANRSELSAADRAASASTSVSSSRSVVSSISSASSCACCVCSLELDRLILQLVIQCVQLRGARLGRFTRGRLGGEADRLRLRGAALGEVARDLRESHHFAADRRAAP